MTSWHDLEGGMKQKLDLQKEQIVDFAKGAKCRFS